MNEILRPAKIGPTLPPLGQEREAERRLDLREILSFLWRQWKFIASVAAVVFALGVLMLMWQTPLYTATAQVLLDRTKEVALGPDAILQTANVDVAVLEGEMAIMRSYVLLQRVVKSQDLVKDPEFGVHPPAPQSVFDRVLSFVLNPFSFLDKAPPPEATTTVPGVDGQIPEGQTRSPAALALMHSTLALEGALKVSRGGQGFLINVSVTAKSPMRAARLANAIADSYLVDKLDTRLDAAKRAEAWLNDRLQDLRKQVQSSEEAVTRFEAEHGLVKTGSNVTLSQQQLSDLNAKLVDARADAAQKRARVQILDTLQAKGKSIEDLPDIGNAGALPALRQKLAALSQEEADLMARYEPTHPLVVNIRAQKRDVERAMAAEAQRLASGLRNELRLADSRVASLEQSLRAVTGQQNIDNATAIKLQDLERTATVNRSLYQDLLQRSKITAEQSTFESQNARVITPAQPPGGPSYPRRTQSLMFALIVGVILGILGAIAKEMLNEGFSTPKQTEYALGLPVLASVSQIDSRDLKIDETNVPLGDYVAAKPLSRYSEAIRSLRSGVQMTDIDHPPKIVQVTSTVPDEGKTTISLSLAASAARSGLKVLLVEGDLRNPSISRRTGIENKEGLVDLLLGQTTPDQVVSFREGVGYWFLSAGRKVQNPPDLLGSERMKALIAGFRDGYDLVVIDSPPAGPVIDPIVLSHICDKVVLVVRWGSTARELVKHCAERLGGHAKIAGVVLNRVNERQAQKYGRYGYSYYYGRYYKSYYTD
ncbi:MAG TPA: polysaccharide biosynthesis tyrosine autokinase [Alphaproteobacteria bacterium]|nr:polysaccharide biosynthesis tyrosine autokinase [Alphaproteobacteria bacterium]